MHALRHFYASVLLDTRESIKAVSECLGQSDPGLTLKAYAHLMPSSRGPCSEGSRPRVPAARSEARRAHSGPR